MDQSPSTALAHQAIQAALDCRWDEAIVLNEQIIKNEPENIDALNRLGRAYFELGQFSLAKKYYSQTVKFDSYNPIAIKNLKIIKACAGSEVRSPKPKLTNGYSKDSPNVQPILVKNKISPSLFLQEPGKTRIVNLLKVAEPQKLSHVFCGMHVDMIIKNRKIMMIDSRGEYLGILPDDVSFQMLRLIKGGNQYCAFVKSIKVNGLSIMIRETYRSKRFRNQPSFLDTLTAHNTDVIASLDEKERRGETEEEETGAAEQE